MNVFYNLNLFFFIIYFQNKKQEAPKKSVFAHLVSSDKKKRSISRELYFSYSSIITVKNQVSGT